MNNLRKQLANSGQNEHLQMEVEYWKKKCLESENNCNDYKLDQYIREIESWETKFNSLKGDKEAEIMRLNSMVSGYLEQIEQLRVAERYRQEEIMSLKTQLVEQESGREERKEIAFYQKKINDMEDDIQVLI